MFRGCSRMACGGVHLRVGCFHCDCGGSVCLSKAFQ